MSNLASVLDGIDHVFGTGVVKPIELVPHEVELEMSGSGYYGLAKYDQASNTVMQCSKQSVSSRYVPHQTQHIKDAISQLDSIFPSMTLGYCRWNYGHEIAIQPTEKDRMIAQRKDSVVPRIIIRAPYDAAMTVSIGFYRDMCANMAMFRRVADTHIRIRHVSSLEHRVQELVEQMATINTRWPAMMAHISDMRSKHVHMDDVMHLVYGDKPTDTTRKANTWQKRVDMIRARMAAEQLHTGEEQPNGWLAFNAIQWYEQWKTPRRGNLTTHERAYAALFSSNVQRAEAAVLAL